MVIEDLEDRIANLEMIVQTLLSVLMEEEPWWDKQLAKLAHDHYFSIKSYTNQDPNICILCKDRTDIC